MLFVGSFMALPRLKFKALELRRNGMSYSQIRREVGVSKSTLSLWLRHLPLSEERVKELRDWNSQRIEHFRETMFKKRDSRHRAIYTKEKRVLLPLTNKELYVAGLFLYWGEGGKTARSQLTMTNTDVQMLRFYLMWIQRCLGIATEKVSVKLHLYSDMDEVSEIAYWSRKLRLRKGQFKRSYIKKTTLKGLTYKTLGHGTCNLIVYGREYYEKIMLGIQAISGDYRGLW